MEKKYSRNAGGLSLDVAILHGVFALAVENEMMIKNPVKMEGRPGDNPQDGAAPLAVQTGDLEGEFLCLLI